MAEITQLRQPRATTAVPPTPQEALRRAMTCLHTAHEALRGGDPRGADEALELLRDATRHLEAAWEASHPSEAG